MVTEVIEESSMSHTDELRDEFKENWGVDGFPPEITRTISLISARLSAMGRLKAFKIAVTRQASRGFCENPDERCWVLSVSGPYASGHETQGAGRGHVTVRLICEERHVTFLESKAVALDFSGDTADTLNRAYARLLESFGLSPLEAVKK